MEILSRTEVGGGSINNCYRVNTKQGIYFLKENSAKKFPGMFEAEAKGLELLRSANTFYIPEVVLQKDDQLFLEWLERKPGDKNDWRDAGKKLAQLHKNTSPVFGLDHSNYIGSLPQSNTQHETWAEFFAA